MATYLFHKKVNDFTAMGVNFNEHLYVPEKSPGTGEFFHEGRPKSYAKPYHNMCQRRLYSLSWSPAF